MSSSTSSAPPPSSSCYAITPLPSQRSSELQQMEAGALESYHPPGSMAIPQKPVEWVYNPDGTLLLDHNQLPVSVDRLLATKPLRHELCSRPGPGNKKLTYLSGDCVTRTLNDIFGYDGWKLDIKQTQRELLEKDDNNRYHVAYTATVRLTLTKSGAYKEDVGAGDCMDKNMGTAVGNALKASITDAIKRAARHFGDKLGNSLYQGNFNMSKAPATLQSALDQYEIERCNTKFGFPKDRKASSSSTTNGTMNNTAMPPPNHGNKVAPPSGVKSVHGNSKSAIAPPPPPVPRTNNSRPKPPFQQKEQSKSSNVAPPFKPTPAQQQPSAIANTSTAPSTNRTADPPPSAKQRLENSGLFDLSMFSAGNNNFSPQNNQLVAPQKIDKPRPGTSTGLPKNAAKGGLLGKRPLGSNKENEPPRKQPASVNPYLASHSL